MSVEQIAAALHSLNDAESESPEAQTQYDALRDALRPLHLTVLFIREIDEYAIVITHN